jgi:hypothetical protein
MLLGIAFGALFVPAPPQGPDRKTTAKPTERTPAYPLKKSANGRYLVDQKNIPFLIAGDSPQALLVNLSEAEAEKYFANRKSHGFNAVWINLLCRPGTGGRPDGSTRDGIHPFKTADDLANPNEAYFARCVRMIRLAGKYNLLVILDPCETIDHLNLMLANGAAKCRAFGQYLGNRYRRFENILWMSGNDFGSWQDPRHDAVVTALALGIKDKDTVHLHTVELYGRLTSSLDDPKWAPIIGLNAAYTFFCTYAQVLKDYNRSNFQPVFLVEAYYEFENGSTPLTLRRQEYWANLSGATGQVYGNAVIYPFSSGWEGKLNSPGAVQMKHVKTLFEPRAWYDLVPDQKHTVVVAGYGTFEAKSTEANHYGMNSDYVTAGRTPDGSLVMAYMPTLRSLTVDMSKLSRPATGQWYDPSGGIYHLIKGSPLPNSGKRTFTPPGKNADGDGDWILVLETTTKN